MIRLENLNYDRKPVVFAGSSISEVPRHLRSKIELRPPAKSGDIKNLLREKPGIVILLDGFFEWTLAVTPRECKQMLEKNWEMIGASSIGAIRASELWSLGMIGMGSIFYKLRLGQIISDAEVASMLDPRTFEEMTATLVHIREILYRLRLKNLLSINEAKKFFKIAEKIQWTDRTWDLCINEWKKNGANHSIINFIESAIPDPTYNPKKMDGLNAIRTVLDKIV